MLQPVRLGTGCLPVGLPGMPGGRVLCRAEPASACNAPDGTGGREDCGTLSAHRALFMFTR